MDENGDVKTSTLIIGVLGTLGVGAVGTLVAEAVAPRLVYWVSFPAVIFATVFVLAHQRVKRSSRP